VANCVVPWSFVFLQKCNFWYFIVCIFLSSFLKITFKNFMWLHVLFATSRHIRYNNYSIFTFSNMKSSS
jgi:hypothetical protein